MPATLKKYYRGSGVNGDMAAVTAAVMFWFGIRLRCHYLFWFIFFPSRSLVFLFLVSFCLTSLIFIYLVFSSPRSLVFVFLVLYIALSFLPCLPDCYILSSSSSSCSRLFALSCFLLDPSKWLVSSCII